MASNAYIQPWPYLLSNQELLELYEASRPHGMMMSKNTSFFKGHTIRMSKNKCSQGKPYYGEACRSHDSKGRVTCRACCARMIPGTPLACVCYYTAQNMFIRSFRCLLHVIFQEDLPRVSAIHSSIFLGSTYVPGSQKPIPACSPCGLSLNNIWGCV